LPDVHPRQIGVFVKEEKGITFVKADDGTIHKMKKVNRTWRFVDGNQFTARRLI